MKDRKRGRLPRINSASSDAQAEQDVNNELNFHMERLAESFLRQGMDAETAQRAARERFGDVARAREKLTAGAAAREQTRRRAEYFAELRHDARYALRALWRNRVFASAAVLTLALGIGANTAMFAVAHGLLFRPLPYADADRLVLLWQNNTLEGDPRYPLSPANYRDLVQRSRSFAGVATYGSVNDATVLLKGEPERAKATSVSVDFYEVTGVKAASGQLPGAADGVMGAPRVAMISDGYWRRRFAGNPDVLGHQMTLYGNPVTIVGVLPAGFTVPGSDEVDIVMAQQYEESFWSVRARHSLRPIARLRPGATVEQARAEANGIFAQLEQSYPGSNRGMRVTLLDLRNALVGDVRGTLLVLLGAVSLVLLVACANITNLLLARAAERRSEFNIRAALGAGRARLIRQLLTESGMLALLGTGAGLLLAATIVRMLRLFATASLPLLNRVQLSGPVLTFALGLTVLTALLVGTLPALQSAAARLATLRENTRGSSAGRLQQSTRRVLVVAQVALSLVLLCGAGLLLRSYNATMAIDPGFNTRRVLTFTTMKMGSDTQRLQFYEELERRLAATPGVQAVGGISQLPLTGAGGRAQAAIEGHSWVDRKAPELRWRTVTAGYFNAMDLRLLRGRLYSASDRNSELPSLILNQETATRLYGTRDPVGTRLRLGPDTTAPWMPVIGVVENARNESLTEGVQPEVYALHAQMRSPMMTMVVRTAVPPLSLAGPVRAHVKALDPGILVTDMRTTAQLISKTLAQPRFTLLLLGGFALLSLLLALIGTYGVLAYFVAQRKREIGIRMALGAQRSSILRLMVGEGARLTASGVIIGLLAALLSVRLLENMLYQVTPADPLTFGATAAVIALTTLLASGIPALAAARLQPDSVMRGE